MNSLYISSHDEETWSSFHEKFHNAAEGTTEKMLAMDQMVQDIISNYESHNNLSRAHQLLNKLEEHMKEFFDNLGYSDLAEEDTAILSELCKKLSDDSMIQLIRDSNVNERFYGETRILIPSKEMKSMSSICESPVTSFRRKANHTRQITSILKPKVVDVEISRRYSQDIDDLQEHFTKTTILHTHEDEFVKESVLYKKKSYIAKTADNSNEETLEALKEAEERRMIDGLFAKMRDENNEHKIENAFKYLQEIEGLLQDYSFSDRHRDYLEKRLDEDKILMEDIKHEHQFVSKIVFELDDESGYEVEKQKKNSIIKYKNLPNGGVSIKLESTVDVPLFNLITLFYEPEGYAKWTPFCKESKLVTRLGRANEVMWLKWDMPPPVSSREGYLIGTGFDRFEQNGSLLLISRTIHNETRTIDRYGINVPAKSKYTRMEIPYVGVELTPLTANRTRMRLVSTFDPKIAFLPLSLMSWIARKGASYLLDTMVKHATNLKGGMWGEYLERSKEFYDWLQKLIDNHLAKKQLEGNL